VAEIILDQTTAVADGSCKEYTLTVNGQAVDVFIVHYRGEFFAYRNLCPHTGISLNWQPDQFLDVPQQHIQCSTHGALFRIEDGYCEWGPCRGQSLTPFTLAQRDGQLILIA
jgi:nitrite reductase/ring-hydroxylating ferredoxin subunit